MSVPEVEGALVQLFGELAAGQPVDAELAALFVPVGAPSTGPRVEVIVGTSDGSWFRLTATEMG